MSILRNGLLQQHNDAVVAVESFAEYVPVSCTHRPSSQPSEGLVRLAMSDSNQGFARWIKSYFQELLALGTINKVAVRLTEANNEIQKQA